MAPRPTSIPPPSTHRVKSQVSPSKPFVSSVNLFEGVNFRKYPERSSNLAFRLVTSTQRNGAYLLPVGTHPGGSSVKEDHNSGLLPATSCAVYGHGNGVAAARLKVGEHASSGSKYSARSEVSVTSYPRILHHFSTPVGENHAAVENMPGAEGVSPAPVLPLIEGAARHCAEGANPTQTLFGPRAPLPEARLQLSPASWGGGGIAREVTSTKGTLLSQQSVKRMQWLEIVKYLDYVGFIDEDRRTWYSDTQSCTHGCTRPHAQRPNDAYDPDSTFSPVVSKGSLHLFLSVTRSSRPWSVLLRRQGRLQVSLRFFLRNFIRCAIIRCRSTYWHSSTPFTFPHQSSKLAICSPAA